MADSNHWPGRVRQTFGRYDEALVRKVVGQLIKPRAQYSIEELLNRALETLGNAPVIDRRLRELPPACRRLLAVMGISRQPSWTASALLSLLAALGHTEGLTPILTLLDEGLLYPELPPMSVGLGSFRMWAAELGSGGTPLRVFALPSVCQRARTEDLGLPVLTGTSASFTQQPREADGLDWPLRLAVVWQQVTATPIRRTQQRDFFKRDLTRLRTDPLLTAPNADHLVDLPDAGLLAVVLAERLGVLAELEGELSVGSFPTGWNDTIHTALADLWPCLVDLESWRPTDGWNGPPDGENPYPLAGLLMLLLLGQAADNDWLAPADLEAWVFAHHPYWAGRTLPASQSAPWAAAYLLGLAFPLRLVQALPDGEGGFRVRLSALGRWLVAGGPQPPAPPLFRQTLLVQPNFEVLVYRQGLTPPLLSALSRLGQWKALGPACQLELTAESVYRGLETGLTLEETLRLLQQHGMRPIPESIADTLRTWSNKRERITVYARATLMEFATTTDLDEALARGIITTKLTPLLGLVANESQLEYRHFRLTGTRDYGAPPDKCLELADDGVTLTVDAARSDLLLETELARLTESLSPVNSRRRFLLTRDTLRQALRNGWSLPTLDDWFAKRTGTGLSPAARLLLTADKQPPPRAEEYLVLQVNDEDIAEGLLQWPATAACLGDRLGPTAVVVRRAKLAELQALLRDLGLELTITPSA